MAYPPALSYNKSDIDKNEFARMYQFLDDIDLPLNQDVRSVRPISSNGGLENNNQPLAADANDITLTDNTHLQMRKRGLSYFHGAMLVIQARDLTVTQKQQAQLETIRLYNDYESSHLFCRQDLLKQFGKSLAKNLKPYGITPKDIQAGEKTANFERERPHVLMSTSQQGTIHEIPMPAHMQHEALTQAYDFILNASTGLRSKIHSSYSLANRDAFTWYNDKWRATQQLLKMSAQMGMAFAKWGLSTTPVFSWFVKTAEKVDRAKQAQTALATAQAPKWYTKHRRVVQDYLLEHAGDEKLPAVPPTLRSIPGLPNMSEHIARFGKDDSLITHKVIRHGTLTPYNIKDAGERRTAALANGRALASIIHEKAIQNFNAFWSRDAIDSENFKDFKKNIPTADLSFMSPYPGMGKVGAMKKSASRRRDEMSIFDESVSWFREDNHAMKRENKEAYLKGMSEYEDINPSSINLGINGDRWMISKTFQSEQYQDQVKDTLNDFDNLKIHVAALQAARIKPFADKSSENKFAFAIKAAEALRSMNEEFDQSFLTSSFTRRKARSKLINAELFASCLYAIVVQGMGGTVSACCKSSKDRTGLFLLHIDAMYAHFAKTGKLIDYKAPADSAERNEFTDILSSFYQDNLQQTMASLATLGAAGLKEPKGAGSYLWGGMIPLPSDMEPAVERKVPFMLDMQRNLADTNKLKI